MGPKNFVTCYICGKEFGAQSITFHEPKCLSRWRSENSALPASQRSLTPVKMDDTDNTESVWTCLRCYNVFPAARRGEHFASCREGPDPKERPKTRTLTRASQNIRPQTMTLDRPSPNIEPPVIELTDKQLSPQKEKPAAEKKVPPPCVSCTRNGAAERFHSHRMKTVRIRRTPPREEDEDNKNDNESVPDFIVCYMCGRNFGSRSFPFHEPHCIERWRKENVSVPLDERIPVPKKPPEQSTKGFSPAAWQTFQAQLTPCPLCGRKFFPNRLPVHQKVCKGTGKEETEDKQLETSPTDASSKKPPRSPMLICYICGRQFGSMSLSLHEPHCLKKWRHENSQLPSHLQRPEPEKPSAVFKEDGTIDTDVMENAAWRSHIEQLVPCSRCSRTFYPDRIEVHERNCKGPTAKVTRGITVN